MIEVNDLHKSYRYRGQQIEAVRGVSLYVPERGQIFGFLGPNGAGKTTTVRVLATLTRPTSGRVRVCGCDLPQEAAKARPQIGYVSQGGGVDDIMPVRANLMLQGRLAGLDRTQAGQRTAHLLQSFDLEEIADRPGRTLSGGQRRRLALALGLLHRPALLFLDEPTLGLDPGARAQLWEEIRSLRDDGTTVFLTTHYLDEADELCDRVGIIDRGRIVAEGTPAELKRSIRGDAVTVTVAAEDGTQAHSVLKGVPVTIDVRNDHGVLRVYTEGGGDAVPVLLRDLEAQGIQVRSIGLEFTSLDDVFLQRTGHSLRHTAQSEPADDGGHRVAAT